MTGSVPLLETVANALASALAAQDGAGRVELCASLGDGSITPSYATTALARERVRIPLYVLIRPRAGALFYSELELETMLGWQALFTRHISNISMPLSFLNTIA